MFTVSVGGCYTNHPAPFKMCRPHGIAEYLLLFVRTKARFVVSKDSFEMLPNQLIIIERNTPYQYYTTDSMYMNDWMHFDCDEMIPKDIVNRPITLNNASRVATYIQQVLWESNDSSKQYRYNNVDMLMNILMNHVKEAVTYNNTGKTYSPYYGKIQDLRLRLQSNPNIDISLEDIAESMSISISYFQHLYTQYFDISFRNDLISMRIERAKELLLGTTYSIETIALLCGYHNEVHFYRQFRKHVDMTPTEYRSSLNSNQ